MIHVLTDSEEIFQEKQDKKFFWEAYTFPWDGRVLSREEWLGLPWKEWMQKARDGDTKSTQNFCKAAMPYISKLCEWRLLTDKLGADEARSMAALATVEFLMTYKGEIRERHIPLVLWRYVRIELLYALRRQNIRRKHNLPETALCKEEEDTDSPLANMQAPVPDPDADPEQALLQEDLREEVRNAMNKLDPKESAVIHSYYFQRKSIGEISRDLHCSPQYIRRLRRAALARLRELLEERLV